MSILASRRNPMLSSYSGTDIQRMYAATDDRLKALILDYDAGHATDADLDRVHSELFKLDDELCARGL